MDLSQVAGPRAKRKQSAAEAQVRCVAGCVCAYVCKVNQ